MKSQRVTNILLLLTALLLQACSSNPKTVHYYLLYSPDISANKSQQQTKKIAVLRELKLAEYLQEQAVVMRLTSNQLQYSSSHLWAESLQAGISKSLIASLNKKSESWHYVDSHHNLAEQAAQQLFVDIEHFVISEDSRVIASGNFWLKHDNSEAVVETFQMQRTLTADGYPHAIEQLRLLLDDIAQLIHSKQ